MKPKIKDNMSLNPMTVRYKDDLTSAYIRMKRENYRHIPVINEADELVGIISDRDFQRAMRSVSTPDAHGLPGIPNFPTGAKICDYMSSPVISLSEETELLVAIKLMIREKISAIAAIKDGAISGIVTHEDLIRILANILEEPSLRNKILAFAYNSPIGRISDMLAEIGL